MDFEELQWILKNFDDFNETPAKFSKKLDYFQKPAKRTIEVIGEKGSLEFNYYKNKLEYKGHVPDDKKIYYEEKFDTRID